MNTQTRPAVRIRRIGGDGGSSGSNVNWGVSLDTPNDALETVSYPIAASTLIEEYGDREISHENGTATVREIQEPSGDVNYESADEMRPILTMIGGEAERRVGFTDREPNARAPEFEQESF